MKKYADVLIVGTGVSGLYCALNLDPKLSVVLVCKTKVDDNNTYLAQGGISTAIDENDILPFIKDTLYAGGEKNKLESVQILARESIRNIDQLLSYGLEFDKKENGFDYTREGAHSVNRILHTKDNTGEMLFKSLYNEVLKRTNIEILEDTYMLDLINTCNDCVGGIFVKNNKKINIFAQNTVLAMGGIGGIFKNSTNQTSLVGDAIAIAIRNNIKLKDLDYIQVHPTAFYDKSSGKKLLISESVRGEGGLLLNKDKKRFVDELLPRNIVSKKIQEQMCIDNKPYVYLDITHLDSNYIKNRFKFIYNECLKKGVDITNEYIKVSPAQHYFMGGIDIDLNAKTSMKNLYAVGETSCSGVHGENRLASNSLLEGLVFSRRAAIDITKKIKDKTNINNSYKEFEKLNNNCENESFTENIEQHKLNNINMVIQEIKKHSGDIYDELFNYR